MNLVALHRWQWSLIGAAAGLLVALAVANQPPAQDDTVRPPLSLEQFVAYARARTGTPSVDSLVIQPAGVHEDFVTGETVAAGGLRRPFAMYAPRPFNVNDVHAASVVDFVREAAASNSRLRFADRWWHATWFIAATGSAVGAIFVGGVWPTLINLVYFGRLTRPRIEVDAFDLSRFVSDAAPPPSHFETSTESSADAAVPTTEIDHSVLPNGEPVVIEAPRNLAAQPETESYVGTTSEPAEDKEYEGKYYPVVKTHHKEAPAPPNASTGFSLLELLVVLAIVAILTSLLVPSVRYARRRAEATGCANHLRQIAQATFAYVNDNDGVLFWRGEDINLDGMDWYAYGGRPRGNANLGQANYFNRAPRPLNRYLGDEVELFRCPNDDAAPWSSDVSIWPAESQFDWVGNSYNFNANGYPLRPPPRHDGGLDGVRFSDVRSASETLMFYEASLIWGADWHLEHKANLAFADGHAEFGPLPPWHGDTRWDPR